MSKEVIRKENGMGVETVVGIAGFIFGIFKWWTEKRANKRGEVIVKTIENLDKYGTLLNDKVVKEVKTAIKTASETEKIAKNLDNFVQKVIYNDKRKSRGSN